MLDLRSILQKIPTTLDMVRKRIIKLSEAVNEKKQGNIVIKELDKKQRL